MKGGPADGSERDITGKSMFCSLYFIIGWASLLGTGGEAASPLIKQGNFRGLLQCQITAVHHAAHSLPLSQLPFSLPTLSLSLSVWKNSGCDVDLHVACTGGQRDREGRVTNHSWSSRQQPHLETVLSHCVTEWMSDDPGALKVDIVNIKMWFLPISCFLLKSYWTCIPIWFVLYLCCLILFKFNMCCLYDLCQSLNAFIRNGHTRFTEIKGAKEKGICKPSVTFCTRVFHYKIHTSHTLLLLL